MAEVHEIFHQDVDRVLGARETGFHHGEPGLHEKHQSRGHQGPEIVRMGLHQVDSGFVG